MHILFFIFLFSIIYSFYYIVSKFLSRLLKNRSQYFENKFSSGNVPNIIFVICALFISYIIYDINHQSYPNESARSKINNIDIKPWTGKWECSVFGEGLNPTQIKIDFHDKYYDIIGRNPFGNSSHGLIVSSSNVNGWTELNIPELNFHNPIGKWVSYNNIHGPQLSWISFEGEGSENPCTPAGQSVNSFGLEDQMQHSSSAYNQKINSTMQDSNNKYASYSTSRLVREYFKLEDFCRGGPEEVLDTPKCTSGRDRIIEALHAKGFCWGEGADSEANSSWKKCKSGVWTGQDGYQ